MKHGFLKVAAASPALRVADPAANVQAMLELAQAADQSGARILLFPELSITGYTCGDLFDSELLLTAARRELLNYVRQTAPLDLLSILGTPLRMQGRLYNCAVLCHRGRILGVVPKSSFVHSADPYEATHFTAGAGLSQNASLILGGQSVPFGTKLIFSCDTMQELKLAVELGSDLLSPIPPSAYHAQNGATLICNPSAIAECVGQEARTRATVAALSDRLHVSYLLASCGRGESTTDMVFGGQRALYENGKPIALSAPFAQETLTVSETDLALIAHEQRQLPAPNSEGCREISFALSPAETALTRKISPTPFIPADPAQRAARCEGILQIQAEGLKQRLERAYAKKAVIGISGGLDSTLALLVAVRAMDLAHRPHTDILAVTMPGFGTTSRTKNNATALCEELGVELRCISIAASVEQHFADIGHDPALRDVTYENSQARERTQVLMDIANECGGMVIGTGDLSELALGWATYNGDHMSMYGVNGDVPKTLIRHMVAVSADNSAANGLDRLAAALRDILDTPVSPELLPADEKGEIAQKTEDLVGPYELHDFYLYYLLRYGFAPEKLYRMARYAMGDRYPDEVLKKWLGVFCRRFFAQQFKRSCLPDGPRVGSVALSPRGSWQMPSDASSAAWLEEINGL